MWVSVPFLLLSGVLGAAMSCAWSLRWAGQIRAAGPEQIIMHTQFLDQAIRWGGGLGMACNALLQLYHGESGQTLGDAMVAAAFAGLFYAILCGIWAQGGAQISKKYD